ncbi:hypothetical protein JAAARDRAFT_30061 [Jaapia argillacea MUCL 33604]|uniref:Uncharacterized protein n=1 Tax=Jaapia argillacea MUCL 33604 TaxID=933084 RepID=A0A067Q527_9AGAM|nr:hypothetical protein JAAARDRAFT_30061 [Jaapia argillacea MUCL 33604]
MSVREVHRATTSPTAWAPATALPSFPVSGFDVTGAQQPFAFGNPITATQRHRVSQSMPATPTADTFDGFSIIPLGPKSIKSNTFSVVGANPCHLEEGVSPLCASFSITSLIGRSMLDLNTESSTSLASPTWFNEADWYGGIGNGSDLYLEEGGLKVDEGLKGAFGFCD